MKIKLTTGSLRYNGKKVAKGEVVEVDETTGKKLIASGNIEVPKEKVKEENILTKDIEEVESADSISGKNTDGKKK